MGYEHVVPIFYDMTIAFYTIKIENVEKPN